ncbi:AcrR family transcriptional regulator [Leptospira hartskeerlii]|uniref:AcrR family transcriptional regulator n=1 Tax=Leptospira hartskeerlii TaxID=2023177 RepID=A0A2M9XAF3_9LEPT|nr:TetR/AcrR family transcriptional regulator [Leptospira hartskeerlii]PJZ24670.1 AcrR family transcriptional regulator [Leptospira hartskeerlii]PJZ33240.1 AcrR family transcriptional regulator [Leptospira hartskeerlii]
MVRTPKKKVKKTKVSKAGAHGSHKGPKKRDRKATETALMKAGIQVFAKKGYDAATTKDIAKAAGANEALIMRYFGGKKGLLEAILTRTDDLGGSATGKKEIEAKPELHLNEALVESITERCSDFKHYSDFMKVAVSRIILDPDVSRIIQSKIYTKALPEMIHELEKFKKGGEIDPKADLKSVAFGISSLTFALGFMAQVVYKIPESEIKATIKEMVRILQKGLKPDSK